MSKSVFKNIIDKRVAREAPIKPFELFRENKIGIGINIEFNIKLMMAAIDILNKINLDFPDIKIRLYDITNNAEIKEPISKNLRALFAIRYWLPKSKFNAVPEKKNIKIKIGRIAMKIHLFTCLLSCFISL